MTRALPPCLTACLMATLLGGCNDPKSPANGDSAAQDSAEDSGTDVIDPDFNGDGALNILVLGTNQSMDEGTSFSPDQIAAELEALFAADDTAPEDVRVVAKDIHMSRDVTIGLGGGGAEYTYTHHSHSLTQYYYWPDGLSARMDNLAGDGGVDWDYVVIGADPYIVANLPGYYALGVHKVASKVAEGDAQPLLLMMWPQDDSLGSSIEHFEASTYRAGDGARVTLPTVPAGLAWAALSDDGRDESSDHPSPNGAYLAAATLYSQITGSQVTGQDAAGSNATLSDVAHTTVVEQWTAAHYEGEHAFSSPFNACSVTDSVVTYNHTGSSSENGILAGLNWVFNQADQTLENGGDSPITFNYGRANTNFEPDKRYDVDPDKFTFSFGFAMQDHGNHGDESMLYGLDTRDSGVVNDTDLGVARFMIDESELPHARAIPIRTLFAQMKEVSPEISAYRDNWHMHQDLDKSIAGYMHTVLTGDCSLGEEPTDAESDAWRTWTAHKIGCDTAWTLMHLQGNSPF
jgi:hypothetical protein